MMLYLRYGEHTILFPGDMTPEGMAYILGEKTGCEKRYTIFNSANALARSNWHKETSNQPSLKKLLSAYGLTVLVAPHHGLESGFSADLYDALKLKKPNIVAISEKRHVSEQDGSVHSDYQSKNGATGLKVNIEGKQEDRYSVSTRDGHHMLFIFPGTGMPAVYLEKDPAKLLNK